MSDRPCPVTHAANRRANRRPDAAKQRRRDPSRSDPSITSAKNSSDLHSTGRQAARPAVRAQTATARVRVDGLLDRDRIFRSRERPTHEMSLGDAVRFARRNVPAAYTVPSSFATQRLRACIQDSTLCQHARGMLTSRPRERDTRRQAVGSGGLATVQVAGPTGRARGGFSAGRAGGGGPSRRFHAPGGLGSWALRRKLCRRSTMALFGRLQILVAEMSAPARGP
jgi:hypothetical protein